MDVGVLEDKISVFYNFNVQIIKIIMYIIKYLDIVDYKGKKFI